MLKNLHQTRRAVTLTELLVVLAILSLLATIAVPVYVQKTEQARRATARTEVRTIADAEEQVALTHGYYIPMHLLDNVFDDTSDPEPRDDFDGDPNDADKYFIDPYINPTTQLSNQVTLADAENNSSGRVKAIKLVRFWTGPYLNPTRVAKNIGSGSIGTQADLSSDVVLDPWGRPYLFFSPVGPIADDLSLVSDLTTYNAFNDSQRYRIDNGFLLNGTGNTDPFDRYAIMSLGTDGLLDNKTDPLSDDVIYEFGFTPNESAYNVF